MGEKHLDMRNEIKSTILNTRHLIKPGAGIISSDCNKFILCDISSNGVYSYNVLENSADYIGGLVYKTTQYSRDLKCSVMIKKNNKLYFIPVNSDYLNIYDFTTETLEYYELPLNYSEKYEQYIYYAATIVDDYLIIFGYDSDYLIAFNINKNKFEMNEKLFRLREKLKEICGKKFFIRGVAIYDGNVYFVSLFKNSIFKLDLKKNKLQQIELQGNNKGFVDVLVYNDELWLIPYQGEKFVRYLVAKEECIVYMLSDNDQVWTYTKGLILGDCLYAITCFGNNPIIIDLKHKRINEWDCLKQYIGENGACTEILACNAYIYIYQYMKNRILKYSIEENSISVMKIYTKKVPALGMSLTCLNEPYEAGLDNFLQCIIDIK